MTVFVLLGMAACAGRAVEGDFTWVGGIDNVWGTIITIREFFGERTYTNWESDAVYLSVANQLSFVNPSPHMDLIGSGTVRVLRFGNYEYTTSGAGTHLTFSGDGQIVLGGASQAFDIDISVDGQLESTGTGALSFKRSIVGDLIRFHNPVTYTGASVNVKSQSYAQLTLGGDTTIRTPPTFDHGGIYFGGPVDGPSALAVDVTSTTNDPALGTTFAAPVGATTPLSSLTIGSPADLSGNQDLAGIARMSNIVRTTGPQTYYEQVVIPLSALTSTAAGDITFHNAVTGVGPLLVNTAGKTTFDRAATVGSLTTDAAGTTAINGGAVATDGSQTYNDPVTLGANTTLASTGNGSITFAATLDGPVNLTANAAGTTAFRGVVGGTTPLATLTTDAPGTTRLGASVTTSGSQTYNDPVVLTAETAVTVTSSGSPPAINGATFANTVNGAFALSVNSAGAATFSAAVGSTTPPTSLTLTAGSVNGGAVTAGSIKQTAGAGTTTFTGLLHATGAGGIDLTANAFSLAGLRSDAGPIVIRNQATSSVSGPVSGPVALSKNGAGTLTLTAANTYTGLTIVNGGTLRVTGSIASSPQVQVNSTATFDAAANQTLQSLRIANGGKAVVSAGTLTLANTDGIPLTILTTGALDLTTRGLVIDVTPDLVQFAMEDMNFYVTSGFHGGDWLGQGIRSSAAAANPSSGVGYALASEALGPGGGTFLGVPVDASAVVARLTLLGDATLDGAVDFNDLVRLAQNYNTTVSATTDSWWFSGDFTSDGKVDFNDLVKLAQNYNSALPATGAIPGAPENFSADLAAAFAAVPEPSTVLAAVAACGFAHLIRRKRRELW